MSNNLELFHASVLKEVIEVIKDIIKKWKDIFHLKAEEGVTPEHKKNILK